ncbi:MAG: PAS domain S-box protein, partial [Phycisphaerae bacterium]
MMKRLYRFFFGTLRGRLIIGVALVHAVMMSLFIGDLTVRQRAMLLDRQIEETTALSEALSLSAAGWLASNDISGLQELVEGQRRHPSIRFAVLVDREGRVLADTDTARRGQYLLDLPHDPRQTVLARTPVLVDVVTPAMIGGRHVGWARIGLGQKAAAAKLEEIIRNGVLYAWAAILIGSGIAWVMGLRITRRLYTVQHTMDAVRSGNHLARAAIVGTDEPAVMAREFNAMLDVLAARDMELRASEERFRSLIFKVQAAIVLYNGQGFILNSNPLAQELLGLSADQLRGKTQIDPEWHFLREDGSLMPAAEYPARLVLSVRQPLRDYVVGIFRRDRDEIVWVLVNAEPECTAAGDITLVIVSFVDITQRKRAEEALREREKHSQALLRVARHLERAQSYAEVLNAAREEVRNIIGYQSLWVYLLTEDRTQFKSLVAGGSISDIVMSEEGTATLTIQGDRFLEEIAAAKEIVVVEDAQTD